MCVKFIQRLCSWKPNIWKKNSQTLRWLGVNVSVLRQQTWAIEYWMGGPSLSLTDTPSGSLWSTSLEFHPPGSAAITASNGASAGLPHLRLPVIKTPHYAGAYSHHFSSRAFMTLNHSQIFVKPMVPLLSRTHSWHVTLRWHLASE